MSAPHRCGIVEDDLRALAGLSGADAAASLVLAQRHKQLIRLRLVRDHAERLGGHEDALRAYELLADLHARHPAAVDKVVLHPAVRGWAAAALRALRGGPADAGPEGLCALAAAAMVRTGTPGEIRVPASEGVMLPSLGRARTGPSRTALVRVTGHDAQVTGGGREIAVPAVPHDGPPGWQGLRTLAASAHGLAARPVLDDLDPFRMPGLEPGPRLTRVQARQWVALFQGAWDLLAGRHRERAAEIGALVTALAPMSPRPDRRSSASSPDAFGSVALSAPADAPGMAVTLLHEVQHAKLTALMDTVLLTRPGGRRYHPDWRPDPRPAAATLHGTYAHLAVALFWRAQQWHESGGAAQRAHGEFARWRTAVRDAAEALLNGGELTGDGHLFVTEMLRTLRDA